MPISAQSQNLKAFFSDLVKLCGFALVLKVTVHIKYKAGGVASKNWPCKRYGLIGAIANILKINKRDQKLGQKLAF